MYRSACRKARPGNFFRKRGSSRNWSGRCSRTGPVRRSTLDL